ncbi:hypothetical protein BGZ89_006399 [Linnemannia elongata]|uniref:Uncharacterized protein n=1 Tax=Linnemannia elongata AG-77 TaxID=1314771 RepID=A0A197JLT2_9FUNG|nr:hypothetical protein BGZ89_006399 [Linnemannia elongata]OAQ25928.1 hypothetical protein K457DRAFT_140749 [Linnemannia elongata AG-77]
MSDDITAGIYLGTPPEDPNADIRKIFTERENQQDGLGTILSFCQREAGFTVGSTDTEGFRQQLRTFDPILWTQDSSVMMPMQDNKDAVIRAIQAFAERVPDKSQFQKFASQIRDNINASFVQFCIQQDGDYLALFLTKATVMSNFQNMIGVCAYDIYVVNRGLMASRADELVTRLKLKDGLGEWVKKVSSPGY